MCILGDCMGSVLAYDILTSMQSCPSPSPLSPSSHSPSPSHSPPPPPTRTMGSSTGPNHGAASMTVEIRRKFPATTPASSKLHAQKVNINTSTSAQSCLQLGVMGQQDSCYTFIVVYCISYDTSIKVLQLHTCTCTCIT